ncbi:MAG: hypothetical protein NVS4B5_08030 [Vulcanimicrobiaceae bacterium]
MIGSVVALALAWSGWALATWPGFHLGSLTVTGLTHVAERDVVARAAIDRHGNVWLLDTRAIERRIAAIPYIATARVHRRPFANVWLDVTERASEACVRDAAGRLVTVDAALRVLQNRCAEGTTLVYDVRARLGARPGAFLEDAELRRLQRDVRALASDGDRFRAVRHDAVGALEATLQDGICVKFGDETDLDRKQRLIGPILAQLGKRSSSVRAVDVRSPATPVVEYREDVHSRPHRINTI